MPAQDNAQPGPAPAMRLIFEYDGDQVRLVSQQPVDVVVQATESATARIPGHYVDTRDENDHTLARVMARNAFAGSTEVFSPQAGEPIRRVEVARPQGAFTVVVPAPAGADHVTVVRVAPGAPDTPMPEARTTSPVPGGPAETELARFPLQTAR